MNPEYEWTRIEIRRHKVKPSHSSLRNNLIKIRGKCCEKCHKLGEVELDHKVPFVLGGDFDKLDNLILLCEICHRYKTQYDILIINHCKRMGWIEKTYGGYWELYKKDVIEGEK